MFFSLQCFHILINSFFPPTNLSSVQSLSRVWLFETLRTAACQASLSITNSWSLLKLMSIDSVMPSNRLILCRPLLLLPSISPSMKVFSESVLPSGGQGIGASASAINLFDVLILSLSVGVLLRIICLPLIIFSPYPMHPVYYFKKFYWCTVTVYYIGYKCTTVTHSLLKVILHL